MKRKIPVELSSSFYIYIKWWKFKAVFGCASAGLVVTYVS